MHSSQKGFTLIELMIALALGLVVVASATLLLISAQRSLAIQQSSAEIQNNANFALDYMVKNLRRANYGNSGNSIILNSPKSGIVFNTNNASGISADAVSINAIGPSNVGVGSDQITIQYLPTASQTMNCEGESISDPNQTIIERYFLRKDSAIVNGETVDNALALACEAGTASNPPKKDASGQIIMQRADYLRVLLIVRKTDGQLSEMPINTYSTSYKDSGIVGVKIAVLARSTQKVNTGIPLATSFQVADQTVSLNSTAPQSFLRETITQTVAFRNAMGTN